MFFKKSGFHVFFTEFLIFVFFFLYVFLRIDPGLIYFLQQPVFLLDKPFLVNHLAYPGGFTDYISLFFSQFYYYPLLGALIITATAIILSVVTYHFLKLLGVRRYYLLLNMLPAVILLALYNDPRYLLSSGLMLLFSVLLCNYYIRNSEKSGFVKVAVLIVSSILLFYISAGVSMLLYIIVCMFYELLYKKYTRTTLIIVTTILISAAIPYLLTRWFFFVTYKKAYLYLFITETYYKPSELLFLLFLYFPFILIFVRVFNRAFFAENKFKKNSSLYSNFAIQLLIVVLSAVFLVKYSGNAGQKLEDKIRYLAYQGNWEQVLQLARENPTDNRLINFHTNRALYHTGRLSYDLFEFPQKWGTHALFVGEIMEPDVLMDNSDLYFDLGYISSAKYWAYEAQTVYENSPRVLKRLVISNIILGNTGAANTLLNILQKSITHKKWVAYYRQCNNNPDLAKKDPMISEKRKMLPVNDFYINRKSPDEDLTYIIADKNTNKMAFEYLMTYYLLSNQLIKFADNLQYMKILGYKEIPKIYEEALMVYLTRKNAKKINLTGYSFNMDTKNRFENYARILISYNRNKEQAQRDLYARFGNSYWYYLHYVSPVTQKKVIKYIPEK